MLSRSYRTSFNEISSNCDFLTFAPTDPGRPTGPIAPGYP